MLTSCLAVLLGLFIIYRIFAKGYREGLIQSPNATTLQLAPPSSSPSPSPAAPPSPSPPPLSLPAAVETPSPTLEGSLVYIYNSPSSSTIPHTGPPWRRRYYSGYEDIYKSTVNRYPGESIRFDLLTPIPYSDAFAAPMGIPHPNEMPKPTLSQITYPHPTTPYQMRL